MPAWRALAIFLFICLLFFFPPSVGECHRISGPIYCHRLATHTRRSQPQSDRPLSYSPHRWFLLMVLIAKLSPPHISSPVCACIQSDGRRGQCPSGRIGRSSVGKITKLQLFSVITQMCWWPDGSLELRSIQPSGLPPNPFTPGIRRSQRWGEEATRN